MRSSPRSMARTAGRWHLPVVGETYDGRLNDIEGMHVRAEHVFAALDAASDGAVAEGAVGGGTGMICHGFKGGIGTASRCTGDYTVGVLVQANHGARRRLTIDGVPVGRELDAERVPLPSPAPKPGAGSIIVLVATDAPLLPHQCARLAQRAALGIARTGGAGEDSSGDLLLAFAVGNRDLERTPVATLSMLANERMNPLFYAIPSAARCASLAHWCAAIEATEEAIVNALLATETMTERGGATAYALPHDAVVDVLRRYGRMDA